MRGPLSVIAMVCSECAVFDPSAERRVQPSASMVRRSLPRAHHGSSAKVMPGAQQQSAPAPSAVGDVGILVHGPTQSMPTEFDIDPIAGFGGDFADGSGDVAEPTAGHGCRDTCGKGSLRRVDRALVSAASASVADDDRDRGIGHPAVDRHREVQAQHVAVT